ncbi:hypothetical protein BSI_37100 [Bacillus inaquosorum KCTC 13429]|uniref:Uncharacterized protein n=1 Tax=Bacillus inaquosorum KCTC 13429 TaxID=1236548 RepID=A0A9W5LFG4_9BACI|nr:hypothetical protein BSI_37100 [Bacillus inaquosorum KCTC 13429]
MAVKKCEPIVSAELQKQVFTHKPAAETCRKLAKRRVFCMFCRLQAAHSDYFSSHDLKKTKTPSHFAK